VVATNRQSTGGGYQQTIHRWWLPTDNPQVVTTNRQFTGVSIDETMVYTFRF